MGRRVLIVGAGMGGLSAAHELVLLNRQLPEAERFEIQVIEKSKIPGGKSASQRGFGRDALGEHGFRFFPQFYRHVIETLKDIPRVPGVRILDTLKENPEAVIALNGERLRVPRRPSDSSSSFQAALSAYRRLFETAGVSVQDAVHIATRTLVFASSCQRRRDTQYDEMSWADFQQVNRLSTQRARSVLEALSENLSAMRADNSSARTIGTISLQMAFNFNQPETSRVDAALPAPTTESWIKPWISWLTEQGVRFRYQTALSRMSLDKAQERISSVSLDGPEGSQKDEPDYVILGVPLEVAMNLIDDDMAEWDEKLGMLRERFFAGESGSASTMLGDMTGVQFYLNVALEGHAGAHAAYPESPWKLTTADQGSLWDLDLSQVDGRLKDVLSAIVSQWDTPGTNGKTARECESKEEFAREVFAQIKDFWHLSWEENVLDFHVDDHLEFQPGELAKNHTPLLIHPVGSHKLRPDATVRARNLFLASDYVRTETDLASMEAANEAARRAVIGLAAVTHLPEAIERPKIFPLTEWEVFRALQVVDDWVYREDRENVLLQTPRELRESLESLRESPGSERVSGGTEMVGAMEQLFEGLIASSPPEDMGLESISPSESTSRPMGAEGEQLHFNRKLGVLDRFHEAAPGQGP